MTLLIVKEILIKKLLDNKKSIRFNTNYLS